MNKCPITGWQWRRHQHVDDYNDDHDDVDDGDDVVTVCLPEKFLHFIRPHDITNNAQMGTRRREEFGGFVFFFLKRWKANCR